MRRELAIVLATGLFMGVTGCGDSDLGVPEETAPAKPIDMSTKLGKMTEVMKTEKAKPAAPSAQPQPKN